MKSIGDKVQQAVSWFFSPKILLINGAVQLVGWICMSVVALVSGLGEQIQYVTFISHFALIITALGLIQTALVDKKADERDPNTPT
jgi:hypothetical protein